MMKLSLNFPILLFSYNSMLSQPHPSFAKGFSQFSFKDGHFLQILNEFSFTLQKKVSLLEIIWFGKNQRTLKMGNKSIFTDNKTEMTVHDREQSEVLSIHSANYFNSYWIQIHSYSDTQLLNYFHYCTTWLPALLQLLHYFYTEIIDRTASAVLLYLVLFLFYHGYWLTTLFLQLLHK